MWRLDNWLLDHGLGNGYLDKDKDPAVPRAVRVALQARHKNKDHGPTPRSDASALCGIYQLKVLQEFYLVAVQ